MSKLKELRSRENSQKILNLFYSIGAAAIFNMVIQLIVYPFFERELGEVQYGVALSMLSVVAITAGTCGYAVNSSRLLGVESGRTASGDYNLILALMGTVCCIIGTVYLFTIQALTPLNILLFAVLIIVTMLRYYSEVEYRITTNFLGYMIYYVLISVGYVVGLLLVWITGKHGEPRWMLALIVGETLAVLFVVIRGSLYRPPFFRRTNQFPAIVSSISFLLCSALIDNVTLHADRILLLAITGDGAAVTTYYIASLIGKVVSMLTLPINSILISYLVRYKGGLTKKLWSIVVICALLFGGICAIGCLIVSPWMIRLLYPDQIEATRPYLTAAVLGQIFYFVSGVLMMILLRFKGEKKQFFFNGAYAVVFFSCVATGTVLQGLWGFVIGILIANALRFLATVVWGFTGKRSAPIASEPDTV